MDKPTFSSDKSKTLGFWPGGFIVGHYEIMQDLVFGANMRPSRWHRFWTRVFFGWKWRLTSRCQSLASLASCCRSCPAGEVEPLAPVARSRQSVGRGRPDPDPAAETSRWCRAGGGMGEI